MIRDTHVLNIIVYISIKRKSAWDYIGITRVSFLLYDLDTQ